MELERTITIKEDTAKLLDLIKSILTDERYGYKGKEEDKKAYTDDSVIHIILEDFYDNLSKEALKSGIKLP
jgi:hypothetical protein